MTNEQIRQACNEIFNTFWIKWRDQIMEMDSPEWEVICREAGVLMDQYQHHPFVDGCISELILILRKRGKPE